MNFRSGALGLLASLACGAALAQPYRWSDAAGRVHYTDTPPPASATHVGKPAARVNVGAGGQQPFALRKAIERAPVTLYTAQSCEKACAQARAALNRRGVPFREVQVASEQTRTELQRVSGGTQVPVLVVGSLKQVGFAQRAFDDALDIAGYPAAGVLPPRNQAAPAESKN